MKHLTTIIFVFALVHFSTAKSQNIDSYIDSCTQKNNFNGTILIEKGGKIRYHKSFGLASRSFGVPAGNETRYKIASITKLFTSVLIMQLHEQGRLDLNKPIITYLPDYSGEAAGKSTIHQLLNHTSGLANIDTVTSALSGIKNGLPVYQTPMTADDLIKKYCSGKLVNEPGKVFDYNNGEYIILGKIIEHIYGKPLADVLKEKIFGPLNLQNTGLLNQYDIIKGLADTYFHRDDIHRLANDLPVYIENWYAAGAMYSTTDDLRKFSDALFGFRLLNKESVDLICKPGLDEYGYGVWSYQSQLNGRNYKTIKRPGRIMGAQGMLLVLPDIDLTIILLSNTDDVSLDDFVYEISKRMIK